MARILDFSSMTTKRLGSLVDDGNGHRRKLVICPWCGKRGVAAGDDDVWHLVEISWCYAIQASCSDPMMPRLRCAFRGFRDSAALLKKWDERDALALLRSNLKPGEWKLTDAASRLLAAGRHLAARSMPTQFGVKSAEWYIDELAREVQQEKPAVHWDCNGAWCGQDTMAFPQSTTTRDKNKVNCPACRDRAMRNGGVYAVAY